jgi:CRISPR-associated protein Csd1
MILQSLANLAHREGLTENPHYEPKDIHWLIRIRPDGRFLALESLLQEPDNGKKKTRSKPRGMSSLAPRAFPGAAGSGIAIDAPFLVGNASFVCGLDVTKEQKHGARAGELERRIAAFRALVAAGQAETNDAGLSAVEAFLSSAAYLEKARVVVGERAKDGELQSNHLIAFVLDTDDLPVHLRPAVENYWSRYRSGMTAGEQRRQCLVTGAVGPTADKHPLIKPVPGGTPSGVAIVSFNAGAFESYGFSRNENAPVSRSAAEAYTTALNRLLSPARPDPRNPNEMLPEQRVLLSKDTIAVFWTEVASRVPAAIGPAIDGGDAAAAEALGIALSPDPSYAQLGTDRIVQVSTEPLRAAHAAAWKGINPAELEDPGAFRLLVLSGGQGRPTIRAYHSSTVQDVVLAVRHWFDDIRLSTSRGRPALRWLLSTLAVRGDKERLPPNLAAEMFLAILANSPLPMAVLETAVRRCRSEADTAEDRGRTVRNQKTRPERMALIKAWLNRARRTPVVREQLAHEGVTYEEVKPAMNDEERNKGYLLGRMFACVERMQELALGEVGATLTDRYFSAACATPQAVFPRLLRMEVHHFRKAREGKWGGSARWLHSHIDRLAEWLVGEVNGMQPSEGTEAFLRRSAGRSLRGFPAFLPLSEQGLFTLGYHQQRAEFFKKRAVAAEAVDSANESDVRE